MPRIMHIVSGLASGGAEHTLLRLISADRENTHLVVSLTDEGALGARLVASGAEVRAIGMSRASPTVADLMAIGRMIKDVDPSIVQTWMYHSNLLGGCIARAMGRPRVIWGLRSGGITAGTSARTRLVALACAPLSRVVPMSIVSCAASTVERHVAMGYARKKMVVIYNGYDTERLKPDQSARDRMRARMKVPDNAILLGFVARWHPVKDHETLIAALALAAPRMPASWICVLSGRGMSDDNPDILALLNRYGVRDRVRLVGEQEDVSGLMNALDLHLLSSVSEAFPNVIAEAMACGTPCVVTMVGDAPAIVAKTGWAVRPRDCAAFANAVVEAIDAMANHSLWQARCDAARQRVVDNYGLDRMVRSYQGIWAASIDGRTDSETA